MIENPFSLSDDQIRELLSSYKNWIENNPEQIEYIKEYKDVNKEITDTFLNPEYLDLVKKEDFINAIKVYNAKLEGPTQMNIGDQRLLENFKTLKSNFRYLINTNHNPFEVANNILEGSKKLSYFSKAFWTPILQGRFPEEVPIWNNKTEDFLKKVGVNLKTNTLSAEEKIKKVSEAFKYFQEIDPELDFFKIHHLMHYGYVNEEGVELVETLLDGNKPTKGINIHPINKDTIKGLVVCDNTGWLEDAVTDLKKNNHIVLWWDKKPTGGAHTLKQLDKAIKADQVFHIYFTKHQEAYYKATIVDYALKNDYNIKRWNHNDDVAWYKDDFNDYQNKRENGTLSKASITFLADMIVRLEKPIPVQNFRFYDKYQAPTQNNMQPYVEILDEEIIQERRFWFVCQGDTFNKMQGQKYLFAPATNEQGHKRHYWSNVNKVRSGDIIFNYSKGIQGVSIAISDGRSGKNPYPTSKWNEDGYITEIKFFDLDRSISIDNLKKHQLEFNNLLKDLNGPFDSNSNAKQGYLFEFNYEAAKLVGEIYGEPFPPEIEILFDVKDKPKPMKTLISDRKIIDFNSDDRSVLMAIKTKPFILLAGLSGTGKSRLVRKLAYHTCAIKEFQEDKPGNFLLIPVRPNWHDSTEILGYVSRISGKPTYITTHFLHFIIKAWRNPEIPFFLCLDEMNLAPVEQYFAEYLSLVETRKKLADGSIITDAILSENDFKEKEIYLELLNDLKLAKNEILRVEFENRGITLPPNLVVMGTVNMDETTHSFSRKVLDRAMTFEMNEINLKLGLDAEDHAWNYPQKYIMLEDLQNEFTLGGQVYGQFKETADKVIDFLETLNGYLEKTAFKIAYRVRDEFLIYCYHNSQLKNNPDNWLDKCLDELTVMKILSRIEGDETKVQIVLDELIKRLVKKDYPKSALKLEEMKEKLNFGYTSFW